MRGWHRLRWREPRDTGRLAAVLAIVFAGLVAAGCVWILTDPRQPTSSAGTGPTCGATSQAPDQQTVVTIIGDAYTVTGDDAVTTWAERLGERYDWCLFDEAVAGSGYLRAKVSDGAFAARAQDQAGEHEADLVIIAPGLPEPGYLDARFGPESDDLKALRDAVVSVVEAARAGSPSSDLMLFSPFDAHTPSPKIANIAAMVQEVAIQEDVMFVDVSVFLPADGDSLISQDGIHPTRKGQRVLTPQIEAGLYSFRVPDPVVFDPASR